MRARIGKARRGPTERPVPRGGETVAAVAATRSPRCRCDVSATFAGAVPALPLRRVRYVRLVGAAASWLARPRRSRARAQVRLSSQLLTRSLDY
mmetsp:Transcript_31276/g.93872  ORF Transcript_31276/g.93872 Transcript_31276/m.93872 type:complete len:94 (+) Transcript_31276:105-386(+)